jgi:hypothetical protein
MHSEKGLSRVILAIVVIAAVAIAGAVAYGIESGLIFGGSSHPEEGLEMVVPMGNLIVLVSPGPGDLNITVKNISSEPVSAIRVVNSTDLPESVNVVFYYDGNPVSQSNVVPVGRSASGSVQVGSVTAGQQYEMTIVTTLQNFGNLTTRLDVTARA